jgi:hypothetical protein
MKSTRGLIMDTILNWPCVIACGHHVEAYSTDLTVPNLTQKAPWYFEMDVIFSCQCRIASGYYVEAYSADSCQIDTKCTTILQNGTGDSAYHLNIISMQIQQIQWWCPNEIAWRPYTYMCNTVHLPPTDVWIKLCWLMNVAPMCLFVSIR